MITRDLVINNKELMKEWNWEKNNALGFLPDKLTLGSNKKVWWKCNKCGYDWLSKISNRAILKRNCPCCANRVVIKGKNDLKTLKPEIAKEWNYDRNADLKPEQFSIGSGRRVWWICQKGHEWQTTILHRTQEKGTNCPICNSGRQTSFAEQCVYYYVKMMYSDAINRYKVEWLKNMELDIFIPSIKYGIEYDGMAWHVKKNALKREQEKYILCHNHGVKLIRLREEFAPLASDVADYQMGGNKNLYKTKELESVINQVLQFLNFSKKNFGINVNINRDQNEILAEIEKHSKLSFAKKYPEISKEWDKTLNGKVTLDMFSPFSDYKGWWKCSKCGFIYKTSLGHRAYGTGCPKCGIEKSKIPKCKRVVMVDIITKKDIKIFQSISKASRELNINTANITMVCKGKRNSAGGYHWRYVEEKKD